MPKYSQTKMFHVGNTPTMDQEQFGEFWNYLSIFNNSTNLQNKKNRRTGEKLTWRLLTGPPAGPAQLPRQRAAWLGQAGRQGARRRAPHGCHAPARRLAAPLARLTSWIDPSLSPEPPRRPLSSPAPPPRAPQPWPTPPPPLHRRSRAPRRPCVVSSCPGAPPPSTSSSYPSPVCSQGPSPPHRPRPSPPSPEIPFNAVAASARPRPRRWPLRVLCEPSYPSSPSSLAPEPCSHRTKITRTHRRGSRRRRAPGHPPANSRCPTHSPCCVESNRALPAPHRTP